MLTSKGHWGHRNGWSPDLNTHSFITASYKRKCRVKHAYPSFQFLIARRLPDFPTSRPPKKNKRNRGEPEIKISSLPGWAIPQDLIPIWHPRLRNTMLIQHVSSKVVYPRDPLSSNPWTPFNWTIHMVIAVLCAVVPVEGLLCLESSRPGAIRRLASKSTRSAGMRTTVGVAGTC